MIFMYDNQHRVLQEPIKGWMSAWPDAVVVGPQAMLGALSWEQPRAWPQTSEILL